MFNSPLLLWSRKQAWRLRYSNSDILCCFCCMPKRRLLTLLSDNLFCFLCFLSSLNKHQTGPSDWQRNCLKSHARIVSSLITAKCSVEEVVKTATVAQPLYHYSGGLCSYISSGLHHWNKRQLKIKHFYLHSGGSLIAFLNAKVTLSLLLW